MIAIDNILVSDEVMEEKFVCDLTKCKGGCCEDGDAGAPLEVEELDHLINFYEEVKGYMTAEGIKEIEKVGKYVYDQEFGWVTPTIKGQMCAYGYRDKQGIVKCAIEQSYNEEKISWKKPISCHLFPIRIKKSKNSDTEYVNYEPREELCAAACKLGKKLKVPAYVFLKEAIIRKYGEEFYKTLEATGEYMLINGESVTKRSGR
jgi:hypothetical protein